MTEWTSLPHSEISLAIDAMSVETTEEKPWSRCGLSTMMQIFPKQQWTESLKTYERTAEDWDQDPDRPIHNFGASKSVGRRYTK